MSADAAVKTPFADFDFSKFFGSFKIPTVDMAYAIESGHKNFVTMTTMSAAAFDSISAIAKKQGEMMHTAFEDLSKHGSEMLSSGSVEEKTAKQIDFAKKGYDAAVAHSKELVGLYTKSQAETLAAIQERIAGLSDEVKTAMTKKS